MTSLGGNMKQAICALAIGASVLGTTATSGSLSDPVIAAPTIVADTTSSSSGTTLIALLAILMAIPALD
jgi:hypothetical protein